MMYKWHHETKQVFNTNSDSHLLFLFFLPLSLKAALSLQKTYYESENTF